MMKKARTTVREVFERNRFVEEYKSESSFHSKFYIQLLVAGAFFMLSIANIISESNIMLIATTLGCVVNLVFAFIARKSHNGRLCAFSVITTCTVLFGFFTIYGGNDGFACLWVVLLPLMAMASQNFIMGLCASILYQIFLLVVFWTPIRDMLPYRYNDEFCMRFPLFFLVTVLLGVMLTVSLQRSEYNEHMHLLELEEMTAKARLLARTDPLTKLANRRFAYEVFETNYTAEGQPHCIVMGDIDNFKKINDTYGHEFGDEVLVIFAQYLETLLPQDYLKVRWGGEEFLMAANAPADEVYDHIEHLRSTIACHQFRIHDTPVFITITFGMAEYADKEGLPKAIAKADNRLYLGKKSKKNCTVTED